MIAYIIYILKRETMTWNLPSNFLTIQFWFAEDPHNSQERAFERSTYTICHPDFSQMHCRHPPASEILETLAIDSRWDCMAPFSKMEEAPLQSF